MAQSQKADITIAVLGPGGVGKSAITRQFVLKEFTDFWDPTITDYFYTAVQYEDKVYKIAIIDTAGQEEFKSILPNCIREAEGFIIVYDGASAEAQQQQQLAEFVTEIERGKMDYLLDEVTLKKNCLPFAPICLAVNKCDIYESQQDKILASATAFAKDKLQFQSADAKKPVTTKGQPVVIPTSAKKNLNINEVFNSVISQVLQYRDLKSKPQKLPADSGKANQQKNKKGCKQQ